MAKEIKRTFTLGKIAYWPKSRKANAVEIGVRLSKLSNGEWEFTAMGDIWNCRHTDCLSCGQNFDTIAEYYKGNPLFDEIYDLWKKYHLNGMNTGTFRQEKALLDETERRNANHRAKGEAEERPLTYADRYEDACEYLKSIGLYIDSLGEGEWIPCASEDCRPDHYPYGHAWVVRKLPKEALVRIRSLIDKGEVYNKSSKKVEVK